MKKRRTPRRQSPLMSAASPRRSLAGGTAAGRRRSRLAVEPPHTPRRAGATGLRKSPPARSERDRPAAAAEPGDRARADAASPAIAGPLRRPPCDSRRPRPARRRPTSRGRPETQRATAPRPANPPTSRSETRRVSESARPGAVPASGGRPTRLRPGPLARALNAWTPAAEQRDRPPPPPWAIFVPTPGKAQRCGAGRRSRQADSFLRPRRRRRARTARPPGVLIRARKPCFRFRRRVLG